MRRSLVPMLLVLGGCALGPDYERPELDVPEAFIQPVDEGESIVNLDWWELFDDPQLDALVSAITESNTNPSPAPALGSSVPLGTVG